MYEKILRDIFSENEPALIHKCVKSFAYAYSYHHLLGAKNDHDSYFIAPSSRAAIPDWEYFVSGNYDCTYIVSKHDIAELAVLLQKFLNLKAFL